jgi:hypothetical protein
VAGGSAGGKDGALSWVLFTGHFRRARIDLGTQAAISEPVRSV